MKSAPVAVLAATLCACAHAPPGATPQRRAGCAAASLVVLRGAAPGAAVDPVETERAILASEAFRAAVTRASPAVDLRSSLEVRRIGKSAVLALRAFAPAREEALAICEAVLDASFLFGREGLDFLDGQLRTLEAEITPRERALHEFGERHDLLVLPISQRLELERDALREALAGLGRPCAAGGCEAGRRELEAEAARARAGTLRLLELELEQQRLESELEQTRDSLALVRRKLADETLSQVLEQGLRVLDRCAPCGG